MLSKQRFIFLAEPQFLSGIWSVQYWGNKGVITGAKAERIHKEENHDVELNVKSRESQKAWRAASYASTWAESAFFFFLFRIYFNACVSWGLSSLENDFFAIVKA